MINRNFLFKTQTSNYGYNRENYSILSLNGKKFFKINMTKNDGKRT